MVSAQTLMEQAGMTVEKYYLDGMKFIKKIEFLNDLDDGLKIQVLNTYVECCTRDMENMVKFSIKEVLESGTRILL
jgi:hypothetical protein